MKMFKLFRNRRKSGKTAYPDCTWENELDRKIILESEHFLSIFPELVWKNIIKHLDYNDLQNLSNSSPFFRNLLLTKRIQFLFKDVFEIVAPQLLGNTPSSRPITSLHFDKWSHHKEVQNLIFNCRLVCHAWNKCISNLAREIHPDWNWVTEHRDKYAVFKFITEAYEFTSEIEIDIFLSKFKNSLQNPFFGQTILLSVPPISVLENQMEHRFYEKVTTLLKMFGIYIINCQLDLSGSLSDSTTEPEQTYLYLIDILWEMPNLINLSIVNYDSVQTGQFETMRMAPTLEKLQSLSMHTVCGSICDAIIGKNTQVSSLIIEQSHQDLQNTGYLIRSFENLKHLELVWCNWNEIDCIKNFDIGCLKLKSFKLKYYVVTRRLPEWSDVFNILSTQLGNNLEELELAFPEITLEESKKKLVFDMLEFKLCLPKLKKIDLTVRNDVSFDFLLGMTESLECIKITSLAARQRGKESENYKTAKNGETVEILRCYSKMYQSNIWSLFPKLKSIYLNDGFNFSWSYKRNNWKVQQAKTPNFVKRWFSRK